MMAEGTRVKLTIPTIDYPEHTDNQTIIRRGEWEVRIKGYTEFMPGEVVEVEGVVDERGRVVGDQVEIITNHKFPARIASQTEAGGSNYTIDNTLILISSLRNWAVSRLQQGLPEPHASLAIGILLGVKRGMPGEFYDQLVKTGTVHLVAASGYNVTVVAGAVLAGLGWILPRYVALGFAILGVGGYVMLSGAEPAIVRAGLMGSLTLMGVMLGRMSEARWLLWVSAWMMLMVRPALIMDVGFQLSVSATVGLLYLMPWLQKFEIRNSKSETIQKFATEFFYPTLAATVATAPVLWWHFGRVSGLGILVNMVILPVVPLIMFLSALTVIFLPVSYLLYVPLWWMVEVIEMFGRWG